jgi:hypothetical protein
MCDLSTTVATGVAHGHWLDRPAREQEGPMFRRLSCAALLGAILLVILAPSTSAAAGGWEIHESGHFQAAFLVEEECDDTGCAYEAVGADIIGQGPKAIYEVCYNFGSFGEEGFVDNFGCAQVAAGAFAIPRDLSAVTIPETTVTYMTCTELGCEPATGSATVSGEVQAIGPATKFSFRSVDKFGDCVNAFSSKGIQREAAGTFTVDGVTHTSTGAISTGTNSFKSRGCEF